MVQTPIARVSTNYQLSTNLWPCRFPSDQRKKKWTFWPGLHMVPYDTLALPYTEVALQDRRKGKSSQQGDFQGVVSGCSQVLKRDDQSTDLWLARQALSPGLVQCAHEQNNPVSRNRNYTLAQHRLPLTNVNLQFHDMPDPLTPPCIFLSSPPLWNAF